MCCKDTRSPSQWLQRTFSLLPRPVNGYRSDSVSFDRRFKRPLRHAILSLDKRRPCGPAKPDLGQIGLAQRFAHRPTGCAAYGSFAAKTGIAKAAIEMIADTANLIRRILRVRVPVQS